jgi:hypothetical protein
MMKRVAGVRAAAVLAAVISMSAPALAEAGSPALIAAQPVGASPIMTGPIEVGGTTASTSQLVSRAEKLRRLDIMLMVTGLRCRVGADDFQADFASFEAHHMAELNHATRALGEELAAHGGGSGALDRISTIMANQYGNGHPWLGCGDLKHVAHDLADAQGEEPLIATADQVLFGDGPQLALAR